MSHLSVAVCQADRPQLYLTSAQVLTNASANHAIAR